MGAKGDIVLFLHADTLVSPTLLQNIGKTLIDPDVVGGGARLAYVPHRLRYRALCALRDRVSQRLGIFGMGPSFFVRRRLFHDVGGFDKEINEEGVDMSKRLRRHGRLVMLDEIVQASARRYERSGFLKTLCAWGFTVALSFMGIHGSSIEKYIWRVVR
jgi:GT2 family glycosyltransferase